MGNPEKIHGLLTWNRREAELHFERSKAEQYIQPWRLLAKDLAESGSAIVSEVRAGRTPCPLVLSLFLEACTTYDRMTEEKAQGESLKAEEGEKVWFGSFSHLDCVGSASGKIAMEVIR
jgi:hypothetical protein